MEQPQHPLVEALVGDPAEPPQLLVLTGYLGKAPDSDYQRLYTDLALSQFVDIAAEGIVHAVHTHSDANPTGPSTVWIRRDAQIRPQPQPEEEAAHRFFAEDLLQGDVTSQYLPSAMGSASPESAASTWPCGVSALVCPTTGCLPTPRCTLGSVCMSTPKCAPSTPKCPPGHTSKYCTPGGPC